MCFARSIAKRDTRREIKTPPQPNVLTVVWTVLGRLQVKLNTDESPGVATEYGIRSIPTCMIFKNGQKVDTVIGAVPKTTLISTITKYLD